MNDHHSNTSIRNIAIIAHVDHGKTTLVDFLLKQSGTFREGAEVSNRFMDSMDLEKEKGITISAKNASFIYKNTKVNIIDTPGHSDFGGEVERALDMVDGAILLVDASEGPLPQTRFVLDKALRKNIKVIICINKVDRSDSRVSDIENEIFDLFAELEAQDDQVDLDNIVYAIAKEGRASLALDKVPESQDMTCLFDLILENIPEPKVDSDGPVQMLVSNIDYDQYVGRLAIGRLISGHLNVDQKVRLVQKDSFVDFKTTALFNYKADKKVKVDQVSAGDIAIISGHHDFYIGDSITDPEKPKPLPRIDVEEPTVAVMVSVNNGPFKGLEGKKVTSREIKERLEAELLYNVSLRVEDTEFTDTWKVMGRGELQLCVLFEQMRRQDFEFLVSKPSIIFKESEDGQKLEPMENAVVDIDKQYVGIVTEALSERKGIVKSILQKGESRTRLEVHIPSRGLIGYRSEFLTNTRGTGLLNTRLVGYEPYKGSFKARSTGTIVADRKGKATAYALKSLESRGSLFIKPQTEVYTGMVVGESNKGMEINVNVTKEKKLTNMRASGTDEALKLSPVKPLNLEKAIEWISDDELIEVTPTNIRIRCKEMDATKRKRKTSS